MPRRPALLFALLLTALAAATVRSQTPPQPPAQSPSHAAPASNSLDLLHGWEIQSSCDSKTTGDQVSNPGYTTTGWHKTTVPNTVVGSLVDDKTYPYPTNGTNMKTLPGMNY